MARSTASSSTRPRSRASSVGSRAGAWTRACGLPGSGMPRAEVVSPDEVARKRVPQRLKLLVHVPAHDLLVRVPHHGAPGGQLAVKFADAGRGERALHRRQTLWAAQAQRNRSIGLRLPLDRVYIT